MADRLYRLICLLGVIALGADAFYEGAYVTGVALIGLPVLFVVLRRSYLRTGATPAKRLVNAFLSVDAAVGDGE